MLYKNKGRNRQNRRFPDDLRKNNRYYCPSPHRLTEIPGADALNAGPETEGEDLFFAKELYPQAKKEVTETPIKDFEGEDKNI